MLLVVCVGVKTVMFSRKGDTQATQLHCVDGKGAIVPVNPKNDFETLLLR